MNCICAKIFCTDLWKPKGLKYYTQLIRLRRFRACHQSPCNRIAESPMRIANDECAMGKLFTYCVFGIWTKYPRLGIESEIICSPEWRLARDEREVWVHWGDFNTRPIVEWGPGPGSSHHRPPAALARVSTLFYFSQQFTISRGPPPHPCVSVCCGYYFRYYDNARDAMMQFRKLQNTRDIIISHREVRPEGSGQCKIVKCILILHPVIPERDDHTSY